MSTTEIKNVLATDARKNNPDSPAQLQNFQMLKKENTAQFGIHGSGGPMSSTDFSNTYMHQQNSAVLTSSQNYPRQQMSNMLSHFSQANHPLRSQKNSSIKFFGMRSPQSQQNDSQVIMDQDYMSAAYLDDPPAQNKRMNWTFLNERQDHKFFCESNRKIKKERLQRLLKIETECHQENDQLMRNLVSKQKRFNSQALSQKYYERVMTPLNVIDKVIQNSNNPNQNIQLKPFSKLNQTTVDIPKIEIPQNNFSFEQTITNKTHNPMIDMSNQKRNMKPFNTPAYFNDSKKFSVSFANQTQYRVSTAINTNIDDNYSLNQKENSHLRSAIQKPSFLQYLHDPLNQEVFEMSKFTQQNKSSQQSKKIRSRSMKFNYGARNSIQTHLSQSYSQNNQTRPGTNTSRPITQNSRLYVRENRALNRILEQNQKLDQRLQIMSNQDLKANQEYKKEVAQIINKIEQEFNTDEDQPMKQKTSFVQNDRDTMLLADDDELEIDDNSESSPAKSRLTTKSKQTLGQTYEEEYTVDPMKEYKQTSLTNTIEPQQISRKMGKQQLISCENPFNRMRIRESDIPLDVLYNKEVNAMKKNEKTHNLQERPLSFSVWKNFDGSEGHDMTRIHVNQQEFILEHEFKRKNLPKDKQIILAPDADVGIPSSNHIQCLENESKNLKQVYSPTTLNGKFIHKQREDHDNAMLAVYAHTLYLKENFPDQIKNHQKNQRSNDIAKFQRRVTMKFHGSSVENSLDKNTSPTSNINVNKQIAVQQLNGPNLLIQSKLTIGGRKSSIPVYKDTRYAQLLDECLQQVKQLEEEKKKNNRNIRKDPQISKDKYRLKIVKPDMNYLLQNLELQNSKSDQISYLKIFNDDELTRVMAKQYYGRWYLSPKQWAKIQKKGYKQQEITELKIETDNEQNLLSSDFIISKPGHRTETNRNITHHRTQQGSKNQLNQKSSGQIPKSSNVSPKKQFVSKVIDNPNEPLIKHQVKRSIYQKEFALTKLLDKIKDKAKAKKEEQERLARQRRSRSPTKLSAIDLESDHGLLRSLSKSPTKKLDRFVMAETFVEEIKHIVDSIDIGSESRKNNARIIQ
ncbi:UNKNOWN [Stylonychia lemnae]|uniref:Uncharacterized protein n=1 Tax=Stylonychia lemnae TaxID=5949 RepID=A0A078APY3_STYLE|nr:UNKNOWN [Stylonychia lemnae]|eukprot:CDW83008.1 UNKNOWN [Stylonychia lemnae]